MINFVNLRCSCLAAVFYSCLKQRYCCLLHIVKAAVWYFVCIANFSLQIKDIFRTEFIQVHKNHINSDKGYNNFTIVFTHLFSNKTANK